MKTALINSGWKTHFVSEAQNKRTYPKTLCGSFAYSVFDENEFPMAPGTDGVCKRCEATKLRLEKVSLNV